MPLFNKKPATPSGPYHPHIPTRGIWVSPNKFKPNPQQEIKSVVMVCPPFTPIPEGGTEWVERQVLEILKEQGCHIVVVTPADADVFDVADVVLSPYEQSATKMELYTDENGQAVMVNYNAWEYYDRYFKAAYQMVLDYTSSREGKRVKPDVVVQMYSNTFDRMFLYFLSQLRNQLRTRTCAVWNTVFPQDPLQSSWWQEYLEFYADEIGGQAWLGYSNAMAALRPGFMRSYLGSFDQPTPRDVYGLPLLPANARHQGVFAATTITPGKCVHLLIEACGRRQIPLVLAARRPQGGLQVDYWQAYCEPLLQRYPSVQYIGGLPQERTIEEFGNYLIHCNPSLYVEPYGAVNRQAGARGAWTVAFKAGGFEDSVDEGYTGSLVQVPQGISYHDVYQGRTLARDLADALGDALAWALQPGNILEPADIQYNNQQRSSYEAVGPQLLGLLGSIPRP